MKFFGDVDFGDNYVSNMVIAEDAQFKTTPKVGTVAFRGKVQYICTELVNGIPSWVALTNESSMKSINVLEAASVWTVTHGLNSAALVVQVYDSNLRVIIPDEIEVIDANTVKITLGVAITGMAVFVTGSEEGQTKARATFETTITVPTVSATVQHNLGYNPNVALYVNSVMVLPESITHNSLFSTTIVFTDPFTGVIRFT